MTSKQRIQRLEGAKPKAVQMTWREFIKADDETMKRYDAQAKANGSKTWEEYSGEL